MRPREKPEGETLFQPLQNARDAKLLDDMRISLDVDNLFNGYRRAARGDGSVPAGYSRDEVDPVGRTLKLSVRKRF